MVAAGRKCAALIDVEVANIAKIAMIWLDGVAIANGSRLKKNNTTVEKMALSKKI